MKHSTDEFRRFDQILPNSASLIDFCQVLPDQSNSTKSVEDRVCTCARIDHQDPDYLIIRFSRYSFLFFTQRLVLSKSYIPSDLDKIYPITRQGTTLSIMCGPCTQHQGTALNSCLLIGQILIDNVGR